MAHIRRHPKSGRWQVRYRDPSGRERSRTFERRVDADRFVATVTADIYRGEYVDPRLGRTRLSEFADQWIATRRHLSQATQDHDRSILGSLILPRFGDRPVASLRQSEIGAWLSNLDASSSTRSKALQKLSAVLRLAVADGAIKVNPCDGVKRPTVRSREGRALSDGEVAKILDAAESVDPSTAAIVWLMARAGLRIGECLALKRSHLAGGMLTVAASMSRREGLRPVKGRDGKGRIIPIPTDLVDRLREHLAGTVASLDGRMFTAPRGGRLRYNNWRIRRWNRIEELASIGEVHPHDLRHTLATRLFTVDGWTVPAVQAYLGHVDPKVTLRIYTHVSAEELPEPSRGHFADTHGL
ncbi:MAG TPA: site-specific integrase [Acidimicrobiia bacterium]|nr:site-specific integrase [Acidimicrobiia bacterium]